MSDILIKDVEMPKDCYVCHSSMGFRFPSCPLNSGPDMTWLLTKRHSDCPLKEFNDNHWHTETPTEGGLYFVYDKYSGYGKRELNKDISMKQLEIAFHDVLAWQKIKPFKGDNV